MVCSPKKEGTGMEQPIVKCSQCIHFIEGVCEIDNMEPARPDEMSCTRASSGKKVTRVLLQPFWDGGDDSGILYDE